MSIYQDVTSHRLIANLCTKMAQEIVEELYKSNAIYRVNKDRNDLIRQIAPTLKGEAKTILGAMLADTTVSDWEKEQIYEALIMDNELPKGGTSIVHKSQMH